MNSQDSFDEHSLFTRITTGDEEAFREVVHHYSPKLMSFVFSITKTKHIAEEIVQEVFLRLWVKRERTEIENLGGWLHRVAANITYTYLRREALEGRFLHSLQHKPVSLHSEVDQKIDYRQSEALLHKALARLPEQQRFIYKLSRQEGLSREEIAALLQISPNTVKSHLTKALQSIKNFLKQASIFFGWLL